jgi:hypothetical protein
MSPQSFAIMTSQVCLAKSAIILQQPSTRILVHVVRELFSSLIGLSN